MLVIELADLDRVALADVSPQRLRLLAAVVADDGVGGVEDRLRRAVVLLELDDLRVRERVLEFEDVRDVRAPEAVDRVVGDDAVGDEVMGGVYVDVVDRLRQLCALDFGDEVEFRISIEEEHPWADLGCRRHRERWCGPFERPEGVGRLSHLVVETPHTPREVGVLRGAEEDSAAGGADQHASTSLIRPVGPDDTGRLTVGRQHLVAHLQKLYLTFGPVGHRHQRPLNQTLRVIAHDHQVPVLPGEQLEPAVLGVVGVLVLVDEDVAEAVGVPLANLGEQLEHVDGADEQVVEVHRVHPVHLALVLAIDVGDRLLEERADHLAVRVGVAELVLGVGDLRGRSRRA